MNEEMSEHNDSMIGQFNFAADNNGLFTPSIPNSFMPQGLPVFNSPNLQRPSESSNLFVPQQKSNFFGNGLSQPILNSQMGIPPVQAQQPSFMAMPSFINNSFMNQSSLSNNAINLFMQKSPEPQNQNIGLFQVQPPKDMKSK
jgi:hypothetical protein